MFLLKKNVTAIVKNSKIAGTRTTFTRSNATTSITNSHTSPSSWLKQPIKISPHQQPFHNFLKIPTIFNHGSTFIFAGLMNAKHYTQDNSNVNMNNLTSDSLKKQISEIKDVYSLNKQINTLLKNSPNQAIEFVRYITEDNKNFSRIFTSSINMSLLLPYAANGETTDILFKCMLSDNHFSRMFQNLFSVHCFVSYLRHLKTNVWQHPQLDILILDRYIELFKEKVCSSETIQQLITDNYDIDTLIWLDADIRVLVNDFPELKENLASKITFLKLKPQRKIPALDSNDLDINKSSPSLSNR